MEKSKYDELEKDMNSCADMYFIDVKPLDINKMEFISPYLYKNRINEYWFNEDFLLKQLKDKKINGKIKSIKK